jgi:carboxyl-terminal processing protease
MTIPAIGTQSSSSCTRAALRGVFTLLLVLGAAISHAETIPNKAAWSDDGSQQALTKEIVEIMQAQHFRKMPIDDALSSMLLDNYLKVLDPKRMIFLQSDIDEFDTKYRAALDNDLQSGKLTSAEAIYQRYYDRFSSRLQWAIQQIEPMVKNETFTGEESIQVDRKNSPWPADKTAADTLWVNYLKNDILNLRIADKPTENIGATLLRRYKSQLERLNRQTAMENYEIFINAYTELYDPHTDYMSPKSTRDFDVTMALSLEGIGAVLEKEDENTKVSRLVTGGPADKEGELKAGDQITGIAQGQTGEEWEDVIGWPLDEVVDLIRGKANTWVKLQVKRNGQLLAKPIVIRREKVKLEDQAASQKVIEIPDVKTGKNLKIGIITIPAFYLDFDAMRRGDADAKSTTRDVAKILNTLAAQQIDGVVIDLRNNGGGSLLEATQLTDLFIDQGPVVQILSADNHVDRRNRAIGTVNYNGPLVVLVNHLSASASEIFAGAIQDYQRGLIVGDQTFGKGTVQTLIPMKEGKLKITEAKFYRVSGDSTQHRGVVPDISFPALLPYSEIGESALEHALPWDKIQSAPHYRFADIPAFIPQLQADHERRMQNNVEYKVLLERRDWVEALRNRKTLPLNLAKREQLKDSDDKRLIDFTNVVRAVKGEKPLKTIADVDDDAQKRRDAKNPKDDFLLMESANILGDWIDLQKNNVQMSASIGVAH